VDRSGYLSLMGFLEPSSAWLSCEQPAGVSIERNRQVEGRSRIASRYPATFTHELSTPTDEMSGPIRHGPIVVPMGRKGGDYSVVVVVAMMIEEPKVLILYTYLTCTSQFGCPFGRSVC